MKDIEGKKELLMCEKQKHFYKQHCFKFIKIHKTEVVNNTKGYETIGRKQCCSALK